MDDFAPSFSLGIDFDLDSEPQFDDPPPDPVIVQPPSDPVNISLKFDNDDDFQSPGPYPDTRPTLKRLRRGPTAPKRQVTWCNVDDEIEDFSSDDYSDELPSTQYKSVCRSSKLSLPKHGVLSSQSSKKRKDVINTPSSANMNRSSNDVMFPKLIVSPLRKFQLIDSDSDFDDLTGHGCANVNVSKPSSSSKARQSSPHENGSPGEELRKEAQASVSKKDDLWGGFCLDKKIPIQTPVFDEVCEELFKSAKETSTHSTAKVCEQRNKNINHEQQINLGAPLPPAHSYFFHDDIRIQNLVRSRLPNFFPLMTEDIRGSGQHDASVIDYMGQFNHGESSKQASGKKKAVPNSSKSRKQSKKTNVEEVAQGSGSWVNPKSSTKIPKNAGKRRVQACGQSTQSAGQSTQSVGHWYTGSNGKRVYVTKTGEELTGKIAYSRYKKDKGGFTKKSGTRKKSGAKKK
ncbi:uncharacterized protein LOC141682678 isoform X1 [Apium graveolens]|uniref:uncharacterized protein LOC141682678 isoform X1 n=1 Tax=Apium graveolens TaxID=4045 RepID=UPI003D7BDA7F